MLSSTPLGGDEPSFCKAAWNVLVKVVKVCSDNAHDGICFGSVTVDLVFERQIIVSVETYVLLTVVIL